MFNQERLRFVEDRLGALLAALIIAFSWSIPATALATEVSKEGPVWLWSESAPYSDAAAKAFSNGDTRLGLRLANKSLEHSTDKRGRLIAHHNLCVAHATKSRATAAVRHCQEARRLADGGFVIAPELKTNGLTSAGLKATDVLDQNLSQLGLPNFGQAHP